MVAGHLDNADLALVHSYIVLNRDAILDHCGTLETNDQAALGNAISEILG